MRVPIDAFGFHVKNAPRNMHGAGGGEYTLSPPRYHRNRNDKMTPAKKLAAALDRMPRFRCAHLPTPLE
ncbi:MAG: hypothetical protein MPK62_04255, partial [Alphaproteobacteria bacterium]|nr:hypothetical protein [Alphaproteobacteria bacterium]